MNLSFTEEHEELRATVRQFFSDKSDEQAVREQMQSSRGWDPDVWKQMAEEIGLAGLIVPESYGGAGQLPQGSAFTSALRTWLTAGPGAEYQSDVGFVDGQVKFARIEFKMTMPKLQPSFKVRPVYELLLKLISTQLVGAPAGMQSAFAFTDREFVWMSTQESDLNLT